MYEVLIAHLRECAKLDQSNNTYAEAADAIEELQKRVPKTPHGRLIDADAMAERWKGCIIEGSIKPLLDTRPTVIEAEEGEK